MAGFNATLDQVEQMIQSDELTQVQEAKSMLDDLCLPADYAEFATKVAGWSYLAAMASKDEALILKFMKQLMEGLGRVADSYHLLGDKFLLWGHATQAGGYSENSSRFLQQAKSCYQATLELTHEIKPYQELKDLILLKGHLQLAKTAEVEHNIELFQKHLKACYELPDQPDNAQFMSMKQTARKLPELFEQARSVTRPVTSRKSATTSSSNTNDGIDKNMIGLIAVVVIVFLLLYACGAA